MGGRLIHGDCLDVLPGIPDGFVDMVLCDLPYGTTQNKWDGVIDFGRLWKQYLRITKPEAAIVLTAAQPFTTDVVASMPDLFRYDLVWLKERPVGFLNASRAPLRQHEEILIFYQKQPTFNPQKTRRAKPKLFGSGHSGDNYGRAKERITRVVEHRMPTSLLAFDKDGKIHPTQKPVALFEYLIKTYTNENEVVLDNCSGSGTTAIAALKCGRRYIAIEKDPNYFKLSQERIARYAARVKRGIYEED